MVWLRSCRTEDAAEVRDNKTVSGAEGKRQHLDSRILNKASSNILTPFLSITQCWVYQGEQDLLLLSRSSLSSGEQMYKQVNAIRCDWCCYNGNTGNMRAHTKRRDERAISYREEHV